MNIREWAEAHQVRVSVEQDLGWRGDEDSPNRNQQRHYVLTLQVDDRERKGITWSQGSGITASPEGQATDVLDCLISDATAYTNARDFEDFAADFGYDSDSRKAEAIYRACGEVAEWLPTLVGGPEEYERLAYEIERL